MAVGRKQQRPSVKFRRRSFSSLLAVLLLLTALPAHAQYDLRPAAEETAAKAPGTGWYNTGQGFIWTGVGMISSGAMLILAGYTHDRIEAKNNPDTYMGTPVWPFFALAEIGVGTVLAVTGLPMSIAGKVTVVKNGGGFATFTGPEQRGLGFLLETGGGLEKHVSLKGLVGCHLNGHVFLGGGLGGTLMDLQGSAYGIPLCFAASRFTLSNRKVAPFIGLDLGAAVPGMKTPVTMYGGWQAGARVRFQGKKALWISSNLDVYDLTAVNRVNIGLRLGYSF